MNSLTYWAKREAENLAANLKTEEEYMKAISDTYDYMLDQITKEINGFYTKYAKSEGITLADAKRAVAKADIEAYERKAAKYVAEKNFSAEANAEMKLYNATMKINRLEMLKAQIGLEMVDGFNDLQQYFDEKLTDRTLQEFERQAGILGESIQDNAKAAHAIVNASFANAKFSDRIWMYQDMLKSELASLLKTGLIQGQNPRALARHLQKRFGVSKSNAERLMRTELARVQTEAQKQSFEANGFDEYTFLANVGCCDVCSALNGKHFKIKKMMPGENAAPLHPNCRCSTAAYMDDDTYNRWLDGLSSGSDQTWTEAKAANSAIRNTGTKVKYSDDYDYSINIDGYSDEVLKAFSECARDVAKKGSEDGLEHMYLVNTKTGQKAYYEVGEENEVGGEAFWAFIKDNKSEKYAFIHNHNTDGSLSETDINTLLHTENVNSMIAVRNDAVIYVAERKGSTIDELFYDELYKKELEELNEDVRNGKITYGERALRREEIVVDCLLRDYSKAGEIIEIDGRK